MVKKLFLVSAQRSGTNALRSILRGNRGIVDGKEYLGSSNPNGLHASVNKHIRQNEDFVPTAAALRETFASAIDDVDIAYRGAEVCVLACKYNAFGPFNPYGWRLNEEPAFLTHVKKAGHPIIHMIRRDIVGAYVSALRASKTGQWHSERGDTDEAAPFAIRLDRTKLLDAVNLRVQELASFRKFLPPSPRVLEMYYEDAMLDDHLSPVATVDIGKLIGRDLEYTGPAAFRKIPWSWEDSVENIDEVRSWLAAEADLYAH